MCMYSLSAPHHLRCLVSHPSQDRWTATADPSVHAKDQKALFIRHCTHMELAIGGVWAHVSYPVLMRCLVLGRASQQPHLA
jgi:hypothetical protein